MINIFGSTRRSFIFPADIDAAFTFFSDTGRILHYLPYISIVDKHNDRCFRMLYSSKELGIFRIHIYCDLTADLLADQYTIQIKPYEEAAANIKTKAGIYSLVSHGYYSSTSKFTPNGDKTQIEYDLSLNAELPIPLGAQFMPDSVVERISQSIMMGRMQEIIDGFIMRSLRAYQLLSHERTR